MTFFCRQHITGVFDPDATVEGHIGCSVLLVPAAKPVRLEDNENCRKMHGMLLDNKDGAVEAARMGGLHTICQGAKDEDMSGGHPL